MAIRRGEPSSLFRPEGVQEEKETGKNLIEMKKIELNTANGPALATLALEGERGAQWQLKKLSQDGRLLVIESISTIPNNDAGEFGGIHMARVHFVFESDSSENGFDVSPSSLGTITEKARKNLLALLKEASNESSAQYEYDICGNLDWTGHSITVMPGLSISCMPALKSNPTFMAEGDYTKSNVIKFLENLPRMNF
jgi:hypothetical protein